MFGLDTRTFDILTWSEYAGYECHNMAGVMGGATYRGVTKLVHYDRDTITMSFRQDAPEESDQYDPLRVGVRDIQTLVTSTCLRPKTHI